MITRTPATLLSQIVGLTLLPWVVFADDPGFLGQPSSADREGKIHGHAEDDRLTGSWGGFRDSAAARGVTIEAVYTGEFVSNFDRGLVNQKKETIYLDNLDLTVTVDTEKAGLWSGGTLFIYGLRNRGRNPTEDVIGDLHTVSNIEAVDKFLLYEAWYEQQFTERFSALVGFHDLNSEFYVSEYSSLFLNSTPGIGPEIAANVTPSIFSKAALGLRLHFDPTDNWYVQAAVYDGDPKTRGFQSEEGEMYILESGVSLGKGTYKVGYWQHTGDIDFNNQSFSHNSGYYTVIDQEIFNFGQDRVIGAFFRWGDVPGNRNEVTSHVDLGLHMHGLIPGRDEDDFGVAYIRANTRTGHEKVVELSYRMVVMPWLSIQPSYQRIENPGGDRDNSTIDVGLLRFELTL